MSDDKIPVWPIVVIGGGASGLMAAVTAALAGQKTLIIEQKESLGKKLLATGNGRCNYTNAHMDADAFHGDKKLFEQVYEQFDRDDTVAFFKELGIYPSCQNGYYYPRSGQASSMLHAFEMELLRLDVSVCTGFTVLDIHKNTDTDKKDGIFEIIGEKETICARRVIVAAGLLASPALGSNGSLLPAVRSLGHQFTTLVPALCGLIAENSYQDVFRRMAGARTDAVVSVKIEDDEDIKDTYAASERGELQLTDYGISGIPVFQISRFASLARKEQKNATVIINFMPDWTKDALCEELLNRFYRPSRYRKNFLQVLNGLVHERVAAGVCSYLGLVPEQKPKPEDFKTLSKQLSDALLQFPVSIAAPKGFEQAQVCAGGIRSAELYAETLESKLVPGLYFCGEILDVDGMCGGYNLQWAWSSGRVAALHASESLSECRQSNAKSNECTDNDRREKG